MLPRRAYVPWRSLCPVCWDTCVKMNIHCIVGHRCHSLETALMSAMTMWIRSWHSAVLRIWTRTTHNTEFTVLSRANKTQNVYTVVPFPQSTYLDNTRDTYQMAPIWKSKEESRPGVRVCNNCPRLEWEDYKFRLCLSSLLRACLQGRVLVMSGAVESVPGTANNKYKWKNKSEFGVQGGVET